VINWSYFPRSDKATPLAVAVVNAFKAVEHDIDSNTHTLKSNEVLAIVQPHLQQAGFKV
jgi:hypothetical protein